MRRLFFCVLCLLCQWTAQAAHAGLIAEKAYFRETAGNVSIETIEVSDFRAYEGIFQMWFETQAIWIRLTPQAWPQADADRLNPSGPQVVRIGPHSLDQIELYEHVGGTWLRQIAGDRHANTRNVCPDDHHCFALNPNRTPMAPLYLRIQTPGVAPVDTNLLDGPALMTTVTGRVTALTVSLTIAMGLLCAGILFAWNRKTPLFYVYCFFQAAVVVFLATNTGMVGRILPMVAPETLNFLSHASLIVRFFFMLIGGWLLLAYHQPTRLYGQLILCLAVVSLSSMGMLLAGHVQTALMLNLLNLYSMPLVQIYGIFPVRHRLGSLRYILLAAYSVYTTMLCVGTFSIWSSIANPKLHSAVNSGGDWRLNGLFVGVVVLLIILVEDKSRRSDKDLEIEALRRDAEQARADKEKLNERSALIDMLTHELKNPLGTIQFSLATLKRALTGDADSLQRVQRIDVSVKRMDDLIEHVADSNKIDRTGFIVQRERMPARELVQELLDEYPSPARFDVHIQEDAAFLADRKMLTLILENLLSNACKYSVPEASITVAVTLLPGAATSGAAAAGVGLTCFEVSNQVAQGQEPDESRLFERYYRHPGVQDQPGMGIGLSLVQSAAEKIGAAVGYRRQGPRVYFNVRIPN